MHLSPEMYICCMGSDQYSILIQRLVYSITYKQFFCSQQVLKSQVQVRVQVHYKYQVLQV